MRRDQAPDRDCANQGLGMEEEAVSQRFAPEWVDRQRGSHVTPVAPAAEPTDPFSSAGPLANPPSWLPLDDPDPVIRNSEGAGPAPNPESVELYAETKPPRPRDTLPSPPPIAEEPDTLIPPTLVDQRED